MFARINPPNQKTTKEELLRFAASIRHINPSAKINFLLVDIVEDRSGFMSFEIPEMNLIHRTFLSEDCKDDTYLDKHPIIYEQFLSYLKETGFVKDEDILT